MFPSRSPGNAPPTPPTGGTRHGRNNARHYTHRRRSHYLAPRRRRGASPVYHRNPRNPRVVDPGLNTEPLNGCMPGTVNGWGNPICLRFMEPFLILWVLFIPQAIHLEHQQSESLHYKETYNSHIASVYHPRRIDIDLSWRYSTAMFGPSKK